MKKIFFALFAGAFLAFTGCGQVSAYPDEFWAVGNWEFTKDAGVAYGPSGNAKVVLHFTRRYNDQYEIEGSATYAEETLSCDFVIPGGSICPIPTCAVQSTHAGTFTGVASISEGVLTAKPVWRDRDFALEHVDTSCDGGASSFGDHDTSFLTQSLQADGGIVGNEWTIDLNDTVFVDDVPMNEFAEGEVAQKTFEVQVPSMVRATALLGLYRELPE